MRLFLLIVVVVASGVVLDETFSLRPNLATFWLAFAVAVSAALWRQDLAQTQRREEP